MSRGNPFAASPRATRVRRPRRAPDHPPVLRRLQRLGLLVPYGLLVEAGDRWAKLTDAEKFQVIEADAAMTDDELRAEHAEMTAAWQGRHG